MNPPDKKPRRRILFVLRGKLGDTVTSFATVRAYADSFPDDDVTLLVRSNYSPLFRNEQGIRVVGFSSRAVMFAKLAMMRWLEPPFDALLALLGAGAPLQRLGRMVRARRKIFHDGRFPGVYPEWPEIPPDHMQFEPAWRVARIYAPDLAPPRWSSIPSLAARRRPGRIIGIAPVSDEPRRTMGPKVVHALIAILAQRHPGHAIHVLVNTSDDEARPLLDAGLPAVARLRNFPTLQALVEELGVLDHLYSTDTGLSPRGRDGRAADHLFRPDPALEERLSPRNPLSCGYGLPPSRASTARKKGCLRPVCLEKSVALHVGAAIDTSIDGTPQGCLLRRHPAARLEELAVLTAPAKPAVPVH